MSLKLSSSPPLGTLQTLSATEILAELPKLTHAERREVARRLFELEEEAQILSDCDRRANENFLILEALEAEDANHQSR